MALIIKGDMPKACNWFDENGKHRFCKVNAFCDCEIYTRGERPSDCPIIGEIHDEHGRLVDESVIMDKIQALLKEKSWVYASHAQEIIDIITGAPTVIEETK